MNFCLRIDDVIVQQNFMFNTCICHFLILYLVATSHHRVLTPHREEAECLARFECRSSYHCCCRLTSAIHDKIPGGPMSLGPRWNLPIVQDADKMKMSGMIQFWTVVEHFVGEKKTVIMDLFLFLLSLCYDCKKMAKFCGHSGRNNEIDCKMEQNKDYNVGL